MDEGRRGDPGRFQETLDYFPVMSARCRQAGIQVLYHNHSYEFEKKQTGAYWLDMLYDLVEPRDLAAELDLCWVKVSFFLGYPSPLTVGLILSWSSLFSTTPCADIGLCDLLGFPLEILQPQGSEPSRDQRHLQDQ